MHDTGKGALIARYQQGYFGVEVFNQSINVLMDRKYQLVASSGRFASTNVDVKPVLKGNLDDFGLAATAVESAFTAMGGSDISVSETDTHLKYTHFSIENAGIGKLIKGTPRAKKVYFEHKGRLIPAHYVEIEVTDVDSVDSEYYSFVINSQTNEVLFKHNLTAQDSAFSYRVYANEVGVPWDSPHGNVVPAMSKDQVDTTTYLDAPMVTINAGPISTHDAWLAEDATITSGNNVFAYADVIAPDGFTNGDFTAETTSAMTFDYKYNTSEPEYSLQNRKGAIVNLFYINNYLHDLYYDHGFDEAAGNAQVSNYGRGGIEGDALKVEAQDYSGFNNANMYTPADGASPRMQMFLWSMKDAAIGEHYGVTVTSDTNIGLLTSTRRSSFGQSEFNVTGEVIRLVDDIVPIHDGCTAAANAVDLAGKIVIIERGDCNFTVKARAAQDAGAIAVLVTNNTGTTAPPSMGGVDDLVKIPSMGLSKDDGAKIYAQLDDNIPLTISMFNKNYFKASSWDNGVIAHEWGHYITNRLIGNASGLSNQQGGSMGEGWGDFHGLLFLAEADEALIPGNDLFQKAYSDISYVVSFYYGLRLHPYSTDMNINPLTFANIEMGKGTRPDKFGNAEVHDAGGPWVSMLWDSYVGLINDERYTFDEARSLMLDYLVASYKMTPITPTYTEARDALLAAAYANDVDDYQTILNAFARRGMGLGAVSPERHNGQHTGVVESYETTLATFGVTSHDIDVDYEGVISGYCSRDGILDKGETGTISFTVMNKGSEVFDSINAVVEVTSGHDVTLANEGKVALGAIGLFEKTTSSPIEFVLNEAATADELTFKISFPDLVADIEAREYPFSTMVNFDFADKALVNNTSISDMEDRSGLKDFVEKVYGGGDLAKGTALLDGTFAANLPVGKQYLFIKNNGFSSNVAYETKPVMVAFNGEFSVSWFQYYEIEKNWDGGVVEVSVNEGDWIDVTQIGGSFEGTGYSGQLKNLLPGRDTFTGVLASPEMETVNFGSTLNGSSVQFRFRMITDSGSSDYGWFIDNVEFSNIVTPVFHKLIAGDTYACENRLPSVVIAASDTAVKEGENINLTATAVDANADVLTYIWTQTAGTAATVMGSDTATLSVMAPLIESGSEDLAFSVTVNDGTADVVTSVTVKVSDVPEPKPISSAGSSGSMGWLALLMLPVTLLRRRTK